MRSTGARLGILVAAVAAAVVLFILLDNGSDNGSDESGDSSAANATPTAATTTTSTTPEVLTIRDGEPVGGVRRLTYDKGERVNLEVRLNRPEEEIHVHGYEIEKSAEKSPFRLSFPARLDGIFEIEVHRTDGSEAQIAELRVNP
jgi:hypothetical protein